MYRYSYDPIHNLDSETDIDQLDWFRFDPYGPTPDDDGPSLDPYTEHFAACIQNSHQSLF